MNEAVGQPTRPARRTSRLKQLYQTKRTRRIAVFLACGLLAYGSWVIVRGHSIPGTANPLWTMPWWGKLLLLGVLTGVFVALFRLGGGLLRDARRLYAPGTGVRSSATSVRWYRYMNPAGLFYNLYLNRDLLRQFTRREIEGRYRGSYLGIVWSMILPLMMLAIYTFVFSVIFKSRWQGSTDSGQGTFAVTLFAGLIAFNIFSECVNRAPSAIIANPNYVKKVVFPLEILSVSTLGTALFHSLISMVILIIAAFLILGTFSVAIVLLPLALLPLIELCLGLGWFLASLGVYVRDTAYAIGIVTQVLFFVSAIFYPVTAVPEALQPIMYLNPLTIIVESFRRVLIWNQPLDWGPWLMVTLVSGAMLLLGYTWFMKTKTGFADVI